jgi:hypothetical protein
MLINIYYFYLNYIIGNILMISLLEEEDYVYLLNHLHYKNILNNLLVLFHVMLLLWNFAVLVNLMPLKFIAKIFHLTFLIQ